MIRKIFSLLFLLTPMFFLIGASDHAILNHQPTFTLLNHSSQNQRKLAKALTNLFWKNIQKGNVKKLNKLMASYYHSISGSASQNKKEALVLIQGLKISNFSLSDIRVGMSEGKTKLVITYNLTLTQQVSEGVLTTTKYLRIDSWRNHGGEWKIFSHSSAVDVQTIP